MKKFETINRVFIKSEDYIKEIWYSEPEYIGKDNSLKFKKFLELAFNNNVLKIDSSELSSKVLENIKKLSSLVNPNKENTLSFTDILIISSLLSYELEDKISDKIINFLLYNNFYNDSRKLPNFISGIYKIKNNPDLDLPFPILFLLNDKI